MSKAGICFYSALSLCDFRSLTETHDLKNCRRSFLHTHIYITLGQYTYIFFVVKTLTVLYLTISPTISLKFNAFWGVNGRRNNNKKKIVFFHLQSIFHFIRLRGLIWRQNSKEIFFWGAQQRIRRRRRIFFFFFFLLFTRGHTGHVGHCKGQWPSW